MKLFACQSCNQVLFFENTACERCGHTLGYLPAENDLSALEQVAGEDGTWRPLSTAATAPSYRFCANAAQNACNWLVPVGGDAYCLACQLNRTIPDLSEDRHLDQWRKLETAKHRLVYTLMRLNLPIATRQEDPEGGLAFDFLGDPPDGGKVLTGHQDGLITIALREADDAQREAMRVEMGEQYRTLLGHFRHEVGHYYWNVLVRDGGHLDGFRALFGDERADYQAALQHHYQVGAPSNWQDNFVSDYATAHPWEDFAETWAHYLHIVSTLETARAYGLSVDIHVSDDPAMQTEVAFNPYAPGGFERIAQAWLPLTYAINSLNRSMGQIDFYPFVLAPPALEKLAYVHNLIHGTLPA
ncbi:MAG: putative zinc-binding peptidase [Gluconacetobacter sp.]|uniref:Putative zinc-binding peptidase n=1 Tax=Gluconacetobacter dulcium TaxID=2729096 RepID=A0A7W4K159_9PROT|nr:putative zinc-binding peptidase [Gluconacetobacter dulcium]MBB2198466.1 putative zinc-binding peptidase [Gluconacetobacter dulcium]